MKIVDTFVLPSLLLVLPLNLTVGFGLTGGAGAIPLLRVILILHLNLSPKLCPCSLKESSELKFKNGGFRSLNSCRVILHCEHCLLPCPLLFQETSRICLP